MFFFFEDWMYHYVEIILKGEQLLDWAEVIASSLRSQLKHAKEYRKNIYMASYLSYCITCVSNITSLPHETWSEDITIYQYFPLLQREGVLGIFRKVHDMLIESVCFSLKKAPMPILSLNAQKLV